MNEKLYFWVDGRVIERSWGDMGKGKVIRNVPCVDMDDPPPMRFGMFRPKGAGWISMPLEELPPEFRLTLLLMGVNP